MDAHLLAPEQQAGAHATPQVAPKAGAIPQVAATVVGVPQVTLIGQQASVVGHVAPIQHVAPIHPLQQLQGVPQPILHTPPPPAASLGFDTLCTCFDDLEVACITFWACGCVTFGQTAERSGRTSCCLGGLLFFFVYFCLSVLCWMVLSHSPTPEELNFPPCALPPPHGTAKCLDLPDCFFHAPNCTFDQPLETQCQPLNDQLNAWPMSFDQKQSRAAWGYASACPTASYLVGMLFCNLIIAAFFVHTRIGIAKALGLGDDQRVAQFGALVYGIGVLSPAVGSMLTVLLGVDLNILCCGCWFCCAAQCQEHIQVKKAWVANGRRPLGPPQMPMAPISNTP